MLPMVSGSVGNAVNTARVGVQQAQQSFNKAAQGVVKSYTSAANAIHNNAATGANPQVSIAAATQTAIDPAQSVVNMLQAEHAYKATLKMLQTAADMEKTAIDRLA